MSLRWVVRDDMKAVRDEIPLHPSYEEKIILVGSVLLLAFVVADTAEEAVLIVKRKINDHTR